MSHLKIKIPCKIFAGSVARRDLIRALKGYMKCHVAPVKVKAVLVSRRDQHTDCRLSTTTSDMSVLLGQNDK
jgi:hypothetical protein